MRSQCFDALEFAVAHHAFEDFLLCRELVLLSDVLSQPSRLNVKSLINGHGHSNDKINLDSKF